MRWDLPRGGVAYMVLGFLAIALLTRMVSTILEKSHFKWFHDNISFISIPALILLWVGVIRRLADYGFTEARIYLLVLSVVVTAYIAVLLVGRLGYRRRFIGGTFQAMTIALAAAAIVFTFIPGISARALGERYLASHEPLTPEKEMPAHYIHEEYRLEGNVDISDCREILPEYSCQLNINEDGTFEVIHEGESLITINALERIDALKQVPADGDTMDVLVYENGTCKVVFREVNDWRPEMNWSGQPLTASLAFVLLK